MARFDGYEPGQFSWVDLMTPDPKAAAVFYSALFGWAGVDTQDDAGGGYTMFQLGGLDVAGMGGMNSEMKASGMPPVWNSYISVEDVDATLEKATSLGAKPQMPAIDIRADGELVGRMSVLADPNGARFSLWQAGSHRGAGVANEPGTFSWNELCSRDPEVSAKFYGDLFGWTTHAPEDAQGYLEISNAGRLNGGILPWREEMGDIPPSWAVYFSVADCDAAAARVQELGGQVYVPPTDIPPGRFSVVADPLGAVFNVAFLESPD